MKLLKKYHNILGWLAIDHSILGWLAIAAFAIINAFQTVAPWWYGMLFFALGGLFGFCIVCSGGGTGEEKKSSDQDREP